jgi:hypothetical protein
LTRGTGSVEATEEETLIALGEVQAPAAPAAPSNATAGAAAAARAAPARADGTPVAMQIDRRAGQPIAPLAPASDGAQQRATPRRIGRASAEPMIDPTGDRAPVVDAVTDSQPAEPPGVEPPLAEPEEPAKTEPPKTEPPKTEPPKAEPPKTEPRRPTIDPAIVTTVIGRHRPEVLKCIAQGRRKDPKMKGTLTLQLQVDASGAVKHAQTSSTLDNPPIAACVARAAQKWKFPARPNGQIATVNYPFVFN